MPELQGTHHPQSFLTWPLPADLKCPPQTKRGVSASAIPEPLKTRPVLVCTLVRGCMLCSFFQIPQQMGLGLGEYRTLTKQNKKTNKYSHLRSYSQKHFGLFVKTDSSMIKIFDKYFHSNLLISYLTLSSFQLYSS